MSKFNFSRVLQNMNQLKRELPQELANDAQKFFNNSFRQQGWDGQTWKVPQRRIPGTFEYKYPKKKDLGRRTRATLVQTGRLRRTVATSLKSATFQSIKFVVDLPYAAVHNDGLPMKNGQPMPKRKYMGDSPILRQMQRKKITKMIDTIWRG